LSLLLSICNRFWNTFARAKEHRRSDSSALNPFEKIR
jgi:hypothetical protein